MIQLYSPTQWSKKEVVSNYFHLCLNIIWAPGPRHIPISKSSSFFLVFIEQKHNSRTNRATNQQVLTSSIEIIQNKNFTVNGIE